MVFFSFFLWERLDGSVAKRVGSGAPSLWGPDRTPVVHVALSVCLWTMVVALYDCQKGGDFTMVDHESCARTAYYFQISHNVWNK